MKHILYLAIIESKKIKKDFLINLVVLVAFCFVLFSSISICVTLINNINDNLQNEFSFVYFSLRPKRLEDIRDIMDDDDFFFKLIQAS